jgi:hypothetical protein
MPRRGTVATPSVTWVDDHAGRRPSPLPTHLEPPCHQQARIAQLRRRHFRICADPFPATGNELPARSTVAAPRGSAGDSAGSLALSRLPARFACGQTLG